MLNNLSFSPSLTRKFIKEQLYLNYNKKKRAFRQVDSSTLIFELKFLNFSFYKFLYMKNEENERRMNINGMHSTGQLKRVLKSYVR